MLFNSIEFFFFFVIVYSLYLILHKDVRKQNRLLLVASYVFYGFWDWRFLSLILISTVVDFFCSIKIDETQDIKRRKRLLFISVFVNLSLLGFFKYCNFFVYSFAEFLGLIGVKGNPRLLNIVLPVGISFYTFQTMSYTIDIYRRRLKPTRQFFDFALFVAFFPQLVAGPIERASRLLPQILRPRKLRLDELYEGCFLIFWGLFLKMFIADNLAKIVDLVFNQEFPYNGLTIQVSLYAFAFQIFCDFAGYSNIARGVGRLMGFDIMVNFRQPYFSRNPREFWQRWHISLSSWLKDYLYIPLGGNRGSGILTARNLMLTMLLGGLWHGAAWTYVLWGFYQGCLLVGYRLLSPLRQKCPEVKNDFFRKILSGLQIIIFFHLTCYGWLLFRAQGLSQVKEMTYALLFVRQPLSNMLHQHMMSYTLIFICLLFIIQIFQYIKNNLFVTLTWKAPVQFVVYFVMLFLLLLFGVTNYEEFIYFQF